MDPVPEILHPALWRGRQLGYARCSVSASGFDALDVELPGGGWPHQALTELLLPHPGLGEIRLLAPSLVAVLRQGRLAMLFDPPACLSGWALAQLGIDAEALLVVYTRGVPGASLRGAASRVQAGGDDLWALEQALKSGHVGALLAWLPPRLAPQRLWRLQLAAQSHDAPAFMLREAAARGRPSAAPLRLSLQAAGADRLAVRVEKRRGPPLAHPIRLDLPAVLTESVAAKAARGPALAPLSRKRKREPLNQ